MLTSSTKIYQLVNQPLYFPFSLLLFHIMLMTNNHRNLWFSGKTLELNALHEPSQAKAVFWNCNLSTQQLFCYQRQPQHCSTRTAFLKHRAWAAYTAFPKLKTADRHSPETHKPDRMEAVYFQDSAVSAGPAPVKTCLHSSLQSLKFPPGSKLTNPDWSLMPNAALQLARPSAERWAIQWNWNLGLFHCST